MEFTDSKSNNNSERKKKLEIRHFYFFVESCRNLPKVDFNGG